VYADAVKAYDPNRLVHQPTDQARVAMAEIARRSRARRAPAFLFVNNRLEGHAPTTIESVADRLLV
jgi:hypothetical protein